ncbi:MAG: putative hydrolase [candidate division CPR2 bacterium GW2011_GWC1_39_9]|uniref:Putative hydrolase n=1 Tax=candidate division CPR2 bacterium GW2011_GWC2_39_10 TaxID=1618345 RepID=A0A0G0PZQ2_UNCC2|nr:MAG: putative hydrolase [candidate division CPR2 bacterium GW2011_GWC2_39_10]KKR36035.1 MAG: putative hydrolase [candidate division CPR2 bacterium GW2011_GWC1_39_9]
MQVGVATKAVIFYNDDVLIINKSDKDEINPKTMDLPGGRLGFGEQVIDGLVREIEEETSLKEVEVIGPANTWSIVKGDLNLVGITFAVKIKRKNDVNLSFEHESFIWLPIDKILNDSNMPVWIKEEVSASVKLKKAYSK